MYRNCGGIVQCTDWFVTALPNLLSLPAFFSPPSSPVGRLPCTNLCVYGNSYQFIPINLRGLIYSKHLSLWIASEDDGLFSTLELFISSYPNQPGPQVRLPQELEK